jgi:uncharacterized repeat protein (TIGR03803 family)
MSRLRIAPAILLLGVATAQARDTQSPNRTDIYNFQNGTDGTEPRGDLLLGTDGALYGTASLGGTASNGTVFRLVPPSGGNAAQLTTLWQFTGGDDGSFPAATLIGGPPDQALYGTAQFDGAGGHGTVFRLAPPQQNGSNAWTERSLWHFSGGADGGNPVGALLGAEGVLFGTTMLGGQGNHGVVFQLSPPAVSGPWTETVLWAFTGGADGAMPVAALITDAQGRLYGTTKAGGPAGMGTVFRLTPPAGQGAWIFDVLWSFTGGADGGAPEGTLVADSTGALYGTTLMGGGDGCPQALWPYYGGGPSRTDAANGAPYVPPGGNGCGVVFRLTPPQSGGTPWQQTILWSFSGSLGQDGGNPAGRLLLHPNGSFYGISTDYSDQWWGSIFKLTPPANGQGDWTETVTSNYDGHIPGFYPHAGVTLGVNGLLYSTTTVGGSSWRHVSNYGYGTIVASPP